MLLINLLLLPLTLSYPILFSDNCEFQVSSSSTVVTFEVFGRCSLDRFRGGIHKVVCNCG